MRDERSEEWEDGRSGRSERDEEWEDGRRERGEEWEEWEDSLLDGVRQDGCV